MLIRYVMAAAMLGAGLLLSGCELDLQATKTLTLQISGTKGTPIAGEYILTVDGVTTRHAIDQEVPFSVELNGHDISCVVQKQGGEGTVRVQLLANGELVAFAWTKEPYGNASVDTP